MGIGAAAAELSELTQAIDGLELPVDRDVLIAAHGLLDRLEAKVAAADAAFDTAELWDVDGATSMTRWLVAECGMDDSGARRRTRVATRLAALPEVTEAFLSGRLSSGQVDIIATRIRPRHVALFAEHEAALVPALARLDIDATITVINDWVDKADAILDGDGPESPELSTLHHNKVGDRGRLDSDLTGDDYAVVAEALRLAGRTDDDTDERRRTRAERDADALVDLCRRLLRDHETPKTAPGRQRPGITIVIDAAELAALELRQLGIDTIAALDEFLAAEPTTPGTRAWYRAGLDRQRQPGNGSATTLSGHDLSPAPWPPPSAVTPPCAGSWQPTPPSSTTADPCPPFPSR